MHTLDIQQGLDGNWFLLCGDPGSAWDFLTYFPGARIACFGQYENALQLTGN